MALATKPAPKPASPQPETDPALPQQILETVNDLKADLAALKKVNPDTPSPARLFAQAKIAGAGGEAYGYKSLGHQLSDIRGAASGRQDAKDRLIKAGDMVKAATGLGEAVGPDGGFLLMPQYVEGILEIARETDSLLNLCDKYEMQSASMRLRAVDETSLATTRRGGVLGYWVDEGSTLTASKPKFRQLEVIPHKVAVLTYITDEMLQDGPFMAQYVSRYAAEELNFQVGDAIVNGTGSGKPLGLLNAACTLSVAKETSQPAATIQTENIAKMWARLHAGSRQGAVWFVNQDVFPQIFTMTIGIGTAGIVTFMNPMQGVKELPPYQILGRPVIEIMYCPTLGTVGDIILADMKQYIAATRGSIMASNSVHVEFLTDQEVFRWIWRVAGQPWWNSALTPFKGTATQSPFITLATRA